MRRERPSPATPRPPERRPRSGSRRCGPVVGGADNGRVARRGVSETGEDGARLEARRSGLGPCRSQRGSGRLEIGKVRRGARPRGRTGRRNAVVAARPMAGALLAFSASAIRC